jgi:hypothetical protein
VEQCITTFLRLYENAVTSKLNGNLCPLRSYDETFSYIMKKYWSSTLDLQREFGNYKIICGTATGGMHNFTLKYLLNCGGGYIELSPFVYDSSTEFKSDEKNLTITTVIGTVTYKYELNFESGKVTQISPDT